MQKRSKMNKFKKEICNNCKSETCNNKILEYKIDGVFVQKCDEYVAKNPIRKKVVK